MKYPQISMWEPPSRDSPEHRLIAAVLLSVVEDVRGTTRLGPNMDTPSEEQRVAKERFQRIARDEAIEFMSDDDAAGEAFTFAWLCEQLELDASRLRDRLIAGDYNHDIVRYIRFCLNRRFLRHDPKTSRVRNPRPRHAIAQRAQRMVGQQSA